MRESNRLDCGDERVDRRDSLRRSKYARMATMYALYSTFFGTPRLPSPKRNG